MSDDAKTIGVPSFNRPKWTLALYLVGAVLVVLTVAFIDGGEEPLHPIVQSVSLPAIEEARP
jgi:hypothetical protein